VKIAFAGDWHANANWAVSAIEYARDHEADIILHLGDYGYDFRSKFRNDVEQALVNADMALWFIDGNHENFNWLYQQPTIDDGRRRISDHVWHLPRGYQWNWGGVQFMSVGGAYSVDRKWRVLHKSWWLEEVLTDEQIEAACAGEKTDILISHDCPSGVHIPGVDDDGPSMWPPLEILRANEHRVQLRKIVDAIKPSEIWHGHYHRRYDALADFGYGRVEVHGLDMDATNLKDNVVIKEI
jgi:predicted phosphodiesterase